MDNIETDNYKLIATPRYGYFYIYEECTGKSTALFTGSEGMEDYEAFKAAYDKGADVFDSLCNEYSFNYDREGNLT